MYVCIFERPEVREREREIDEEGVKERTFSTKQGQARTQGFYLASLLGGRQSTGLSHPLLMPRCASAGS